MIPEARRARGPLWAQIEEDDAQGLPLWKALLIAAALELSLPVLLFGVDWSFLGWSEPPPTPVMSVRLEPPQELPEPPPEPEQRRPKPEKKIRQIEVELPPPLPDAPPPRIALPKPEPRPEPQPKQEEPPPPEPQPEPEPEAPLPSVFRDIKPVKKVRPAYPREAEDQHIQGRVKVRLSVDLDGNVTDVEVLLAEPPGVFDEAVLTAVKQYKFKRDGTRYQADQEIVFKIDE